MKLYKFNLVKSLELLTQFNKKKNQEEENIYY